MYIRKKNTVANLHLQYLLALFGARMKSEKKKNEKIRNFATFICMSTVNGGKFNPKYIAFPSKQFIKPK